MENRENETFHYTYSATEQDEIKAIRKKYAAPEEDKMTLLRRLDTSVTQKATTRALIVGILGALLLGAGMSLSMTELGQALGMRQTVSMVTGIIVGVAGIAFVSCAYPVYNRVVKKERERIAPQILRLADELMK